MSDENVQVERYWRSVQRLKKSITLMLVVSMAIFTVFFAGLLIGVSMLTQCVQNLTEQTEQLAGVVAGQQENLDKLAEQVNSLQAAVEQSGSVMADAMNQMAGQMAERDDADLPGESMGNDTVQANDSQAEELQPVVEEDVPAVRKVYLTFDDGPSIYTQDILDILESHDVKATFFVLGKESDIAKEALLRIVEEGHTLGMHSYSHQYSEIYASLDNFAADFEMLQDYLYEVTGVESTIYRFPGGSSNTVSDLPMEEFAQFLHERDIVFFDWNISSGDSSGKQLTVEELVNNSISRIENLDNVVILFHDSGDKRTTVDALPLIIENILAMENTVILPITEETEPVQHIEWLPVEADDQTEEGRE